MQKHLKKLLLPEVIAPGLFLLLVFAAQFYQPKAKPTPKNLHNELKQELSALVKEMQKEGANVELVAN